MPEEILIIVIVSILAGTSMSLIRMILGHRERTSLKGSVQGASMTTSELERMMKRAVEEATEPLARKVEELELASSKRPRQLEEASADLLLEIDEEENELAARPSTGARNRS